MSANAVLAGNPTPCRPNDSVMVPVLTLVVGNVMVSGPYVPTLTDVNAECHVPKTLPALRP